MDSQLLNVFHDDPFDGNYVKYENDADFWTSGSDTMGLHFTETLHGILPIAPTEDVVVYDNAILKDDYVLDSKDDVVAALQAKNAFILDNEFSEHLNGTVGAVEIVTIDPDAEDTDNFESDGNDDLQDIDNHSQYSTATFRSRTDSSSIGDYESHTSDYDDEEDRDEYDVKFLNCNDKELLDVLPKDITDTSKSIHFVTDSSFKLPEDAISKNKNRTISINTIGSDVDGLGLQFDANTFDLAEFITQDDFALTASTCNRIVDKPTNRAKQYARENAPVQVVSSENVDSDTDSDVIVDVETVEIDAEAEKRLWLQQPIKNHLESEYHHGEVSFVDNVRDDPSWSPAVHVKKETLSKEAKKNVQSVVVVPTSQSQLNLNRNFSLVPSKRQCDFLKGKFGSGYGKNPAIKRCLKSINTKVIDSKLENTNISKMEIIGYNALGNQIDQTYNKRKVGVGQGGKNLALIKHERHSISEQSSEEYAASPNKDPRNQLSVDKKEDDSIVPLVKKATVKRKLNLEEYKQRRGESGICSENIEKSKIPKTENELNIADAMLLPKQNHCVKTDSSVSFNTTPAKHSEAVTSIVKIIKGETIAKPNLDPITEAKNKVLRLRELKKAQLLKIIDSTVSAKVPRVTKVLPLKDIVKDTYNTDAGMQAKVSKSNTDYEEIVIVSASCNTDISIAPIHILPNAKFDTAALKNVTNNASRSLLKSSALLYNISNTFQKVQATDNVKLSTNSLIVSIQNVVVKQTTPIVEHIVNVRNNSKVKTNRNSNNQAATVIFDKNAINSEQHGEDKIIMHLRKDRIRQRTISASVQTEILPEFPPLPMPMPKFQRKSRGRRRQQHTRAKRHINSSANSMSFDDSSCSSDRSRSYRSRSRSCSSSNERLRRSGTTGGYSSLTSSSRRHRSSLSSSYSESERNLTRRNRKSNYRQRAKRFKRSSSNSSSNYSDRSRSRRTRSRSPINCRNVHNSNSYIDRNVSQPAVEERRIVYVGRIEQETTKEMLRRKFIPYGPIKQITIHYKDTGMKYGFVTYDRSQDAFAVIDNSSRDAHISMYDISFGGRRAFCRASYADLDNAGINTYHSYVFPKVVSEPKEEDSFEALLLKVKAKMTANKATTSTDTNETSNNI